jgi:hypothetical protein
MHEKAGRGRSAEELREDCQRDLAAVCGKGVVIGSFVRGAIGQLILITISGAM